MLQLIPSVKKIQYFEGFLSNHTIHYPKGMYEKRLELALAGLKYDEAGIPLEIHLTEGENEAYKLRITECGIEIEAGDSAGAFYAVQTLKQIFQHENIPYLEIEDKPDFTYRGFYHDITRGKIPTVETVKQLIDQMAYYKMNSLQLYVEHVYEFEECKELIKETGYYTKAEMQELDAYCKDRFIDFIPSLSTFGHLCEMLELEQFKHLRVLDDFKISVNRWHERMAHHTINPLLKESEDVIKSLIDQYVPAFTSDTFNICCDETFDLRFADPTMDTGKLYVDFTKKIIDHVKSKGKKVMMWGDVLLEHPEYIGEIPDDILFLNWDYEPDVKEDKVRLFSESGRKQIVCPGTTTWSRLCENVAVEEQNISKMIEYGYKYGALGVLNTNWGDWGNPCSVELAMYGLVLGAAKSWTVETAIDDKFYCSVNRLLYGADGAIQLLAKVSEAHDFVRWLPFTVEYLKARYGGDIPPKLNEQEITAEKVKAVQEIFVSCKEGLESQTWDYEEAREELLIAVEGVCMMAELKAKMWGIPVERMTNANEWLAKYSAKWEQKNKPCELSRIQEMFEYLEQM